MHELSLCRNIIDIINQHGIAKKVMRVKKICVEIGELIKIDHEAMLFSFDVAAKGTIAENAILSIIEIKGKAFCRTCSTAMTIRNYYDACPTCGQVSLEVTQGEELRIKYMEIE